MTDSASTTRGDRDVVLGVVVGAHGIRGAVRIKRFFVESELAWRPLPLALRQGGVTRPIKISAEAVDRLTFEGVTDRDAAEALRGAEIVCRRGALPEPGDDEVYAIDLVGLTVELDGRPAGEVIGLEIYPTTICLVVRLEGRATPLEVPAAPPFVDVVDLARGTIALARIAELEPTAEELATREAD